MDEIMDYMQQILKAYDEWKCEKNLADAYDIERKIDKLRIMMGMYFDDLRSLVRAARDLDKFITSAEMQQELEDSDFSAESLIPDKIEDVFEQNAMQKNLEKEEL